MKMNTFKKNSLYSSRNPKNKGVIQVKNKVPPLTNSVFNSKLFINLDINEEPENDPESISNNNTDNSDNSYDEKDIKDDDYYLSNELISELDYSNPLPPKIELNNSLLPLMKNGYEFFPKNFYYSTLFINKNKKYHEKKNDWICVFCNNLNFSFRIKCNRCGLPKEISEKQKIFLIKNSSM